MSFKIRYVRPNEQSIFTQLIFNIDINCDYKYNYPVQVNGVLKTARDNKEIAILFEYKNSRSQIDINLMDNTTQYKYKTENQITFVH